MQYKLIQKRNPANRKKLPKWYAAPVNNGKITPFQLNRRALVRSSLDKDTVKNTIDALTQEITELLLNGYSVSFNNMGTFRVSFSSEGVSKAEDFSTEMINNLKIIFTPSVGFQKAFKEQLEVDY